MVVDKLTAEEKNLRALRRNDPTRTSLTHPAWVDLDGDSHARPHTHTRTVDTDYTMASRSAKLRQTGASNSQSDALHLNNYQAFLRSYSKSRFRYPIRRDPRLHTARASTITGYPPTNASRIYAHGTIVRTLSPLGVDLQNVARARWMAQLMEQPARPSP